MGKCRKADRALYQDERARSISAKDLQANFTWLRPVLQRIRDKVPSGYFLADVLLILDIFLNNGMLKMRGLEYEMSWLQKQKWSLTQANLWKKLFGYIRYLYRNGTGSKYILVRRSVLKTIM